MRDSACKIAYAPVDADLELEPSDAIEFIITEPMTKGGGGAAETPRVTLTLRHPNPIGNPVIFRP